MSQDMIYKTMVKNEILPKLKEIYDKAMIEELKTLIDDIEKRIKLQESVITTTIKYSHDGSISND